MSLSPMWTLAKSPGLGTNIGTVSELATWQVTVDLLHQQEMKGKCLLHQQEMKGKCQAGG
jgi:hypothetical protein